MSTCLGNSSDLWEVLVRVSTLSGGKNWSQEATLDAGVGEYKHLSVFPLDRRHPPAPGEIGGKVMMVREEVMQGWEF